MNSLKFIRQNGFGNRRIEFRAKYQHIERGAIVDGTSTPKRIIFLIGLVSMVLAYNEIITVGWIWLLPVLTFLVILPESNGLFFMAGVRHDIRYQKGSTWFTGKLSADFRFLIDMIKLCTAEDCNIYTKLVGVSRAVVFFLGVVVGGWVQYWKYVNRNRSI